MKELFLKHKILIIRIFGSMMLLIAFMIYFWTTPKEGFTKNEIAAANVARMEARASGGSSVSNQKPKSSSADILKELKNTQDAQVRYLIIISMILGIGLLGYSFMPKKKD